MPVINLKLKAILTLVAALTFFLSFPAYAALSPGESGTPTLSPTLGEDSPNVVYKSKINITKNFVARKYILGPNDVISILVPDYSDYNQPMLSVQPDGKITVMPLGLIDVSGMSVEDFHTLLVEKYRRYLRDPQIVVRLDKTKPFVVYVAGAVVIPGSFELDTDTSKNQNSAQTTPDIRIDRRTPLLSNILVAAGGITNDADLEHVRITNRLTDAEFEVNLLDIVLNGDANQDIYLMPGDSIYVPKLANPSEENYRKFSNATFAQRQIPVRVLGYVNSPGLIRLEAQQSNHLISAIAAAGGYYKDSAYAPEKVIVSRFDADGKMTTRSLDPSKDDITLFPNDLVYVPDKTRPMVGRAFDFLARIITPLGMFSSSYNNWALMFNPQRYQPSSISR